MRLLAEIQHAARSLARAPLLVVIAADPWVSLFHSVNAVALRPWRSEASRPVRFTPS